MRTQGSLRVVLNTKVWAGMLVEMPSEKSVRITAVDHEDGIKIYLIMVGSCYYLFNSFSFVSRILFISPLFHAFTVTYYEVFLIRDVLTCFSVSCGYIICMIVYNIA